jgi:mono/diheme cytochrome c family protein
MKAILRFIPIVFLSLSTTAFAAEAGQRPYNAKCASCHGKDGETPDHGKMPGYKDKLSDDEIKAVAAYVRTFK